MVKHETKIRVRYGETDQMGYAYYGVYAQYYEVARVESLRSLGISYRKMEEDGIMLPVINFNINYKKPAFYDDEVRIVCMVKEIPSVRITFDYECYNQENELLNTGTVTLVFVDKERKRPTLPPDFFVEVFEAKFNEEK